MNVCELCRRPVIERDGEWVHAELADEMFCLVVMRGGR